MRRDGFTAWGWGAAWQAGVVLLMFGCVWKGGAKPPYPTGLNPSAAWEAGPFKMRVYPSTRFDQDAGESVLQAMVELVDEMGDPVKGVGVFRFELFSGKGANDLRIGQRLYSWDVSTATLEDQRAHYDSITRSYLFRLKVDDTGTAHRETLLQVMFTSSQGRRLEASSTLPINLRTIHAHGSVD